MEERESRKVRNAGQKRHGGGGGDGSGPYDFASPKSAILQVPSAASSRFSGFISRCSTQFCGTQSDQGHDIRHSLCLLHGLRAAAVTSCRKAIPSKIISM